MHQLKKLSVIDFVLTGTAICATILVTILFTSSPQDRSFLSHTAEKPERSLETELQKHLNSKSSQKQKSPPSTSRQKTSSKPHNTKLPSSGLTSRTEPETKNDPVEKPKPKWNKIVIHHSGGPRGSVEMFDRFHRKQGIENGAIYHIVIGNGNGMNDGSVQATKRWRKHLPGPQTGNPEVDQKAIGICLVGNFEKTAPTAKQINALKKVLLFLVSKFQIPVKNVRGARNWGASTLSPGSKFPMDKIQDILEKAFSHRIPGKNQEISE